MLKGRKQESKMAKIYHFGFLPTCVFSLPTYIPTYIYGNKLSLHLTFPIGSSKVMHTKKLLHGQILIAQSCHGSAFMEQGCILYLLHPVGQLVIRSAARGNKNYLSTWPLCGSLWET